MRFLALILAAFCSSAFAAEECGLYQVEDFGNDHLAYTIVDFVSMKPQKMYYRITNQSSAVVGSMINGLCYCVDGDVTQDPQYPGDRMYQLLVVNRVSSGPAQDCSPSPIR